MGLTINGHEGSFWGDGNVLKLDLKKIGSKFAKIYRIVHLL